MYSKGQYFCGDTLVWFLAKDRKRKTKASQKKQRWPMECKIATTHKNSEASAIQEPCGEVEGNYGGLW